MTIFRGPIGPLKTGVTGWFKAGFGTGPFATGFAALCFSGTKRITTVCCPFASIREMLSLVIRAKRQDFQ